MITKPLIAFEPFLNEKPDYLATASGSVDPHSGNSAIPVGPVAFRPCLTTGLALSALFFYEYA